MPKKGQAALEFLMTYGWAILVVLIIIGVIAAFVLRNPQQFLPTGCTLSGNVKCEGASIGTGQDFQVAIRNAASGAIKIEGLTLAEPAVGGTQDLFTTACEGNSSPIIQQMQSGVMKAVTTIQPGDTAVLTKTSCTAESSITVGTRVNARAFVQYTDLSTGLKRTAQGDVTMDVE